MDTRSRLSLASIRAEEIPKGPAVYALYRDDDRRVYVGSTENLRERVWGDDGGGDGAGAEVATMRRWLHGCSIAWIECESREQAQRFEDKLKSEFAPPFSRG